MQKKTLNASLDEFHVAPIGTTSNLPGTREKMTLRVLQSLIPLASKTQMNSYAVRAWFSFVMPKLQKEGWNFHDAFSRAASLWNASLLASQYNFRLPYEWSERKYRGRGKGGTVEIQFHIKKILEIPDMKQETIARSLGLDLGEIWPDKILGRNQFQKR